MSDCEILNNFVEDLRQIDELTIYTNDEIDTQFIFDCNEEFTLAFIEGVLEVNVKLVDNKPDITLLIKSNDILLYPNAVLVLKDLKEKYKDL
jgi:hypothetical protein